MLDIVTNKEKKIGRIIVASWESSYQSIDLDTLELRVNGTKTELREDSITYTLAKHLIAAEIHN